VADLAAGLVPSRQKFDLFRLSPKWHLLLYVYFRFVTYFVFSNEIFFLNSMLINSHDLIRANPNLIY